VQQNVTAVDPQIHKDVKRLTDDKKDSLCTECGKVGFRPIMVDGWKKYECIHCNAQIITMDEALKRAKSETGE